MQETQVQSLGWEDPLEEEMVTHSSILAWRIPWTEEPGKLQSMESQRIDTTGFPGRSEGKVPGTSPGGSRVIRRWGRSRRLWKYTYLIPDIKRLEMDCVVGRLLEKKRLNNLDYVE